MLRPAWHCVTTRDAVARPGEFVTVDLLDQPVLVRNCDGEIRAFQNVCAHRHAKMIAEERGSCARIRCKYHGWEYDADGHTQKVPDARSFMPIKRGSERIKRFRAGACGQLVFVSLAEDGPGLQDWLGEATRAMIEDAFGNGYVETATWTIDHAANWKVPVENALEGYHVPQVHPTTLKRMSDPRDATHTLERSYTALETRSPPVGLLRWISAQWRRSPRGVYAHHHSFPTLLVARTDISSLAQIVLPTSPTTSRSFAACFVHRGEGARLAQRVLRRPVREYVTRYTKVVMHEDDAMFGDVQRGLRVSEHAGVIGAREERVHAFQRYLTRAIDA